MMADNRCRYRHRLDYSPCGCRSCSSLRKDRWAVMRSIILFSCSHWFSTRMVPRWQRTYSCLTHGPTFFWQGCCCEWSRCRLLLRFLCLVHHDVIFFTVCFLGIITTMCLITSIFLLRCWCFVASIIMWINVSDVFIKYTVLLFFTMYFYAFLFIALVWSFLLRVLNLFLFPFLSSFLLFDSLLVSCCFDFRLYDVFLLL